MDQNKIGKFIAESRKAKNLTQEQLAEILGLNNRTISRWENGKTMPDISIFKPLCKTLDISVEELINGEKTNKKDITKSYEKAIISTINSNETTKKKMNKLVKILLLIIFIILVLCIFIITYYQNKYPKIDIYNLSPIFSDENKLNEELTLDKGIYKIYFYGIDSLQLGDSKNNYFDLKTALKYNQATINDIKTYLEQQHTNGNIERVILYDGGTTIYKSKKYEAILCDTLEGNTDLYFGTPNLATNLKGAYCGHRSETICTFIRTYYIVSIQDDNDENFINVTLTEFQGQTAIVRINKTNNIQAGNSYEFTFSTYETFEDTISNIFQHSTLIEVRETNRVGLEQTNETICINNQ